MQLNTCLEIFGYVLLISAIVVSSFFHSLYVFWHGHNQQDG